MNEKFYKIGEVSKMLELPASTLRYWENHFKQLRPVKSTGGQRFYTDKHIEMLKQLKEMLHNERYTIKGAKQRFKELYNKKDSSISKAENIIKSQESDMDKIITDNSVISKDIIRKELQEILLLL